MLRPHAEFRDSGLPGICEFVLCSSKFIMQGTCRDALALWYIPRSWLAALSPKPGFLEEALIAVIAS